MENEQIKENLIRLIKSFNNTCSECGRLFLGALLEGSSEVGRYPVDVGISSYPLSCGKCPGCAKNCYENLIEYVEKNNQIPCSDSIIDEDEYFEDIKHELDCLMYLDENFQWDQLGNGNPNVEGGELIDLFDLIEEEIIYLNKKNEYERKHQLIKNFEEEDRNKSSEPFLELLEDEDSRIRMEVINILANKDNLQINEKLLLLLQDEEPNVRIKVIEVLGKKGDPQLIEKLIPLLQDENPSVRINVIEVLGKNETPQICEKMLTLLMDPNSKVREKLIEVLGKQNNPQILHDIFDLINDDSHNVRRKVIEVFSRINDSQVFQKVFNQLKSENKESRKATEVILVENNSQNVINKLIDMLKSDNNTDWEKALKILSRKKRSDYLIEKLNIIIDTIFDRLDFNKTSLMKYLTDILNIDKSASLKYLIKDFNSKSDPIRSKLLELIEKINDKNKIKKVILDSQIYDYLIAILTDRNRENKLRILMINLLKNLDSEINVMNLFITVMIGEQESNSVRTHIKKVYGELILFKVDNLNYFLNYFIDNYETFDDRQKRLMYKVLLLYEQEFIRNKDYKKKPEIIEILIKLLRESEKKNQIKEDSSEKSLLLQRNINNIIKEIIYNITPNYLIPLYALLRIIINKKEYGEIRYNFLQRIKREFFKSPGEIIRYLKNIDDDLKPAFYDIMRDLLK